MTEPHPVTSDLLPVTFRPMTLAQSRQRREYFQNNLLPVLLLQQRRKELGADRVKDKVLL